MRRAVFCGCAAPEAARWIPGAALILSSGGGSRDGWGLAGVFAGQVRLDVGAQQNLTLLADRRVLPRTLADRALVQAASADSGLSGAPTRRGECQAPIRVVK